MTWVMKKLICILVMAFCVSACLYAQDSYYYYHGKQYFLIEDATKVVVISPKGGRSSVSPVGGMTLVETVDDPDCLICVYALAHSATLNQIKASIASSSNLVMPCYKTSEGQNLIPNGYINVKLKTATDYETLRTQAALNNCEIMSANPFMPLWYSLRVNPNNTSSPIEISNTLFETGLFKVASPSFSVDALEISYDPDVISQWGLYNSDYENIDISASQAWSYSTGRGIKIAIVDQGIDMAHKDLAANIFSLSYDTETNSSPSKVYGSHGTHCAGIAADVRNNGIQVAGVAPDAKLMSVSNKLLLNSNLESKLANGINWAWKNGADVISCSWWCSKNEILEDAIDSAVIRGREGKGCVFTKSAGNTSGAISYPGDYSPNVLAIANMTQNGRLSASSARGANLFVTAPGTGILSTVPNNGIAYMSGTSMACPHVAGVAALILARNPKLTSIQVKKIIAENTKEIGVFPYSSVNIYGAWNEHYGYGLIDAYKAVLNTPR